MSLDVRVDKNRNNIKIIFKVQYILVRVQD